ncbi:MAG: archease [Desulfobacteraceae bacterium]|jgi:SHS2 domain-containing protein
MNTTASDYTLLDHTADLRIKVYGTDLKDLFKGAGRALMHLMVKTEIPNKTRFMKISVSGEDLADLMVRWLGEILYLFSGESLVVSSIRIESVSASHLEATLETFPFEPEIHETLREIKAVTYHQIEVTEIANGWEAKVVFDV